MHCPARSSRFALALVSIGLLAASLAARAQVAAGAETSGSAVESCERAARDGLSGGPAAKPVEVTFNAAPVLQTHLSSDSQLVLRGSGRSRSGGAVRSFTYSCNVDARTLEAIGVAMRDSTPAAPAVPDRAPAEPDLSRLSPAACESSAVLALKRRWPLVSQISFEIATRSFGQRSASRADLRGTGRAMPAPGLPSTFFGFDCEIDPRDGQVLRTNVS